MRISDLKCAKRAGGTRRLTVETRQDLIIKCGEGGSGGRGQVEPGVPPRRRKLLRAGIERDVNAPVGEIARPSRRQPPPPLSLSLSLALPRRVELRAFR